MNSQNFPIAFQLSRSEVIILCILLTRFDFINFLILTIPIPPFSFGRQHIFLLIWFVFPSQIKAQSKLLISRSYFSGIPLISISYPIKDRTSDFRIKIFPSYVRSLDFQTSMQLFISLSFLAK